MIEKNFYKYQSIGNDFIVFDWLKETPEAIKNTIKDNNYWSKFVQKICDRHFGIGSDGLLILIKTNNHFECLMFNPDGTNGQKCLNGIRCIAQYLMDSNQVNEKFQILMSGDLIDCQILEEKIQITINRTNYMESLEIPELNLFGHVIDVGNPHFVINQTVTKEWLLNHGNEIENYPAFPDRTNVEFVWESENKQSKIRTFNLFIHERGCGFTLACGSGAAATVKTLQALKFIEPNEKIILKMPGGFLETFIETSGKIIQLGNAEYVFQGKI